MIIICSPCPRVLLLVGFAGRTRLAPHLRSSRLRLAAALAQSISQYLYNIWLTLTANARRSNKGGLDGFGLDRYSANDWHNDRCKAALLCAGWSSLRLLQSAGPAAMESDAGTSLQARKDADLRAALQLICEELAQKATKVSPHIGD